MMELMYQDKGGSTAVLGALQGCIDLGIKKNIIFACAFAAMRLAKMLISQVTSSQQ